MKRQAGFTLTEVMLVLVVGALLLGSSVALYNQLRNNSGQTNAWQRVLALQTTVEDQAVINDGKYPSIAELRVAWKLKRSADYNSSPWGGGAFSRNDAEATASGIAGGDVATLFEDTSDNIGDSGILYYYRHSDPTANGWLKVPDLARGGKAMATRLYLIAITDPKGDRYFFVQGAQLVDGDSVHN